MEQKINIDNLDDLQKQALVCMYYAMLPKTDARYKQRMHDWEVLEKRFGQRKQHINMQRMLLIFIFLTMEEKAGVMIEI